MVTPKTIDSKILLQGSIRELHNSMVSPPGEGGLKEESDADNNKIISGLTLHNILLTQLKNLTLQYKFMCVCECCISAKIMKLSLLSWHECF